MADSDLKRNDFLFSESDEPHVARRRAMIEKYPEIKNLYGHDQSTKWIVLFWVVTQWMVSFLVGHFDLSWTTIIMLAYCYGAFPTHSLFLAMHEISHNLAFSKPLYNSLLGCFANMATAFPHFSMFQRYHMEHHKYQGVEGVDVDVPTKYEGDIFRSAPAKTLWMFCQPLVYVFRPLLVKPKDPGFWEAVNWSSCVGTDFLILYFWGHKSLGYLILSTFLSSGLHPMAGHFIAEHYVFKKGTMQETYSYYGILNLITFNVGYHNEHHDFPRIPGSRLPELRAIAPEYYDNLYYYTSWTKVIWDFITDPSVTPFNRVIRKDPREAKRRD